MGIVVTAGNAVAEPPGRSGNSAGNGRADTTGAHNTDRFGYNHTDANSIREQDHRDALREYRQPAPAEAAPSGGGTNSDVWTPVLRADGSGWVVCRNLPARPCGK